MSDDNTTPTRRDLPGCQYGVPVQDSRGSVACGEPAVAAWDWGQGELYVCREHDAAVEAKEESPPDACPHCGGTGFRLFDTERGWHEPCAACAGTGKRARP